MLTRVHRRDEHDRARQGDFPRAARDGDAAVLHRLAHHLERRALEFREFVEKQHAVVRQTDLPRPWDRAAAEQADVADRVVRRAKWTGEKGDFAVECPPGRGMDGQDLEKLVERRRRHDRRDTLGDHRLTRARRSDHDDVVTARHRHFHRAAHGKLSFDLGEIVVAVGRRDRAFEGPGRFDRMLSFEKPRRFIDGMDWIGRQPVDQGGFAGRFGGQEDATLAHPFGQNGHRQRTFHRPRRAGETQLAGDQVVGQAFGMGEVLCRGEDAKRDRQIVDRSLLAEITGGEVDRGAGPGWAKAAVGQGREDAVVGLLHRRIGQPDEDQLGIAALAGVDLHLDWDRFNTLQGSREYGGEHRGAGGVAPSERSTSRCVNRRAGRVAASAEKRALDLVRRAMVPRTAPAAAFDDGLRSRRLRPCRPEIECACHDPAPPRASAPGDRHSMVIGLTGGIGCGKSTAAAMFETLGWGRVESDEIVRTMLQRDAEVIAAVREAFGDAILGPDGGVDRRRMAAVVFPDPAALKRLESILHPRVRAAWKARVAQPQPDRWVVEIPLLFEKGLEKEFDFTVCVASDPGVQAQRLASRGLPPQEAAQRIARQLPLAQKIERADFVLTNNGSLDFLRDQVVRLTHQLMRPVA